jgi:hypothetical protein
VFDVSFAVQNGDDLHGRNSSVDNHVLMQDMEKDILFGEIAAFVSLAWTRSDS